MVGSETKNQPPMSAEHRKLATMQQLKMLQAQSAAILSLDHERKKSFHQSDRSPGSANLVNKSRNQVSSMMSGGQLSSQRAATSKGKPEKNMTSSYAANSKQVTGFTQ